MGTIEGAPVTTIRDAELRAQAIGLIPSGSWRLAGLRRAADVLIGDAFIRIRSEALAEERKRCLRSCEDLVELYHKASVQAREQGGDPFPFTDRLEGAEACAKAILALNASDEKGGGG